MKKIFSIFVAVFTLAATTFYPVDASNAFQAENATRVSEVPHLREENSDTYLLSNGNYECVIYSQDKYYKDADGEYAEIDNTIVKAKRSGDLGKYAYRNVSGDTIFSFSESDPSILVETSYKRISFSYGDGKSSKALLHGAKEYSSLFDLPLYGKNSIIYPDVSNSVDFVYTVANGMLKEHIVLKTNNAPSAYVFAFETNGLLAQLNSDGMVEFADEHGKGIFSLESLFAIDAAGAYIKSLNYKIISADRNCAKIMVSISTEYLKSPERAFPVIIDPTITTKGGSKTKDSFVSSSKPNQNFYLESSFRTGYNSEYGKRRTYIRFVLPSSITGDAVLGAYLNIKMKTGSSPNISAYRVTSSWESNTVTWNNQPSAGASSVAGPAALTSDNWYRLYLTNLTKQWLNGTYQNYGLLLRDATENSSSQWTDFYSSEAAAQSAPQLVIVYSGSEYYANMYLGRNLNDPMVPGIIATVDKAFNQKGYRGVTYQFENTPSNCINIEGLKSELKSKTIFSCLTHGTQTSIRLPGDIWFKIVDFNTINASELTKLKFVYLGACSTGKGGNGATNFVNSMYAKGVDAVLGFRIDVNANELNHWTKHFMQRIAYGDSISQAMSYASNATAYALGTSADLLDTNYYYLCGSGSFVPCPQD